MIVVANSRKKLITSSILLLGVGVVVVAGIMLYPSLRERYWIWKLESKTRTERLEATERLGAIVSVGAISALVETHVRLFRGPDVPTAELNSRLAAIRRISERNPERGRRAVEVLRRPLRERWYLRQLELSDPVAVADAME